MKSSARTVTRSPLCTDSAVREASRPKAVTLTQRVMLSPPGVREGRSRASRSSTPGVPSRVVNGRGSSPRRPVTVMADRVHGYSPWWACPGEAGRPGGGPGTAGPFPAVRCQRREGAGPSAGRPGGARCFPSGHQRKDCAGVAGTTNGPRLGEKICAPSVASAARGRLREPTQRRKLTSRDRDVPQSGATTSWPGNPGPSGQGRNPDPIPVPASGPDQAPELIAVGGPVPLAHLAPPSGARTWPRPVRLVSGRCWCACS